MSPMVFGLWGFFVSDNKGVDMNIHPVLIALAIVYTLVLIGIFTGETPKHHMDDPF